jgi:hypothetical protein
LAVDAARKAGKPVAVAALTDENTEVAAQPDGTLVATVHADPVRTRRGGKWVAIDTSLHSVPDGGIAPTAVLPGLEFSGGGSQPLVRMSSAGKQLTLTWPKPLPAPVVSGDTVEYRSILPDVDLRMTAVEDGFTQLIVVKTVQAAQNPDLAQLTLGMASPDLTMRENTDGSLSAVDTAGGGTVFVSQKPMMFDSSPVAQDGPGAVSAAASSSRSAAVAVNGAGGTEPDEDVHAAPVEVQVAADQQSLTLTPDQDLLNSPATVYPVMIDPKTTAPHAGGWAGISRANPSQTYWKFSYNGSYVADFGTGYCIAPTCASEDVKRVLYSIPVHGQLFNGKHILTAEFDVLETHSYSCTHEPVDLYATSRIGSGTTWNNSSSDTFWAQSLQEISDAKGYTNCAAGNLEFGGTKTQTLRDKVQQAADGNWTDLTLGLRAGQETSQDAYEWKRFGDDASLLVSYNLPPKQIAMGDMSMSPGSVCQSSALAVNNWPQVTARAYDPDLEKIGVQFAAAWDNGSGFKRRWWSTGAEGTAPASNAFKASGSQFSVTLPSAVPGNTGNALGWEARAWDGAQWGPWSSAGDSHTDCYFKIDTSIPDGPVITSSSFPGSSSVSDELPWTDGVGRYGTFTFDTAATDAVKYEYSEDRTPGQEVATTGGAAVSVRLLQQSEGPHSVTAVALDAAGNASSWTIYYFNVRAGQPETGSWAMEDDTGASALSGGGGTFAATLAGGASGGEPGHTGSALSLPGTADADGTPADFASTAGAVLDTSGSFTVSAWVSITDTGTDRSALGQDGSYMGGFSLGLYGGKWTFKTPTLDASGYTWQSAVSTVPVVANQWTHLTGVYNQAAHTVTVYVNGVPSTPVAAPAAWAATGALQFGRYRWHSTYTDRWSGSLDEVKVWNRALSSAEAASVAADQPLTSGLPAKAFWPLDAAGTTMDSAPDTSSAVISGDVATGVAGGAGSAAHFGATGYARTSRPQVDGARSFSVSAWVKLPAPVAGDTQSKLAVAQNGVHNNEFSLYYSPSYSAWIFGRYQADTSADTLVRAVQPACTVGEPDANGVPCIGPTTGEWTHLVGVSDVAAHSIQLYVNGYLVSTVPYTQTAPWPAPGGLQMGAVTRDGVTDEFFGGDIDDVHIYDRVVTATEIHGLVQQRPQLAARWKFNEATDLTPATTPDDLNAYPVTLSGQARIDSDTTHVGSGALSLNGAADGSDAAATQGPPLHTGESFTIAGWAQTAGGAPDHDETVWSIAAHGSKDAVILRWDFQQAVTDPVTGDSTNVGQWQVETVDASRQGVHTTVEHTYSDGGERGSYWNHLVVTYDSFTNQLALYVNGQLQNQVCDAEDTTGTCADHVSFAGANQPGEATGELKFGHSYGIFGWTQPFSGQIDDIWAYQGVLSPEQINVLAGGDELDSATGLS